MDPFYWLLAYAIAATLYALVVTYMHFISSRFFPLPLPDLGNTVLVCPDSKLRDHLLQNMRTHGISPRWRADSPLAERAIYWEERVIINVPDAENWASLGKPGAGWAVVCKSPLLAAGNLQRTLEEHGYSARVIHNPDSTMPTGAMSFVLIDDLPWMVIFRRHVMGLGSPPAKWIWND